MLSTIGNFEILNITHFSTGYSGIIPTIWNLSMAKINCHHAIPLRKSFPRKGHRSLVGCEMGWQSVGWYMLKFYGKVKPFFYRL